MKSKENIYSSLTGHYGESYVIYKLAGLGLRCSKLDGHIIKYDLLVENEARIEVKTASLLKRNDKRRGNKSQRKCWSFTNNKKLLSLEDGKLYYRYKKKEKFCDFFVFVCVESDTNEIKKVFIVPADVIGFRTIISIPEDFLYPSKFSLKKYQDRWDLIQGF